ncbi:hypothetical protein BH11BAC5_BH11BAC5_51140 [soil metagenome]
MFRIIINHSRLSIASFGLLTGYVVRPYKPCVKITNTAYGS